MVNRTKALNGYDCGVIFARARRMLVELMVSRPCVRSDEILGAMADAVDDLLAESEDGGAFEREVRSLKRAG